MKHVKPDATLDVIGLFCPVPLWRAREEIEPLGEGAVLEVLADDPAALEDIPRWAKGSGHVVVLFKKEGDVLRFLIRKGGGGR